jgi:hypothetical protein
MQSEDPLVISATVVFLVRVAQFCSEQIDYSIIDSERRCGTDSFAFELFPFTDIPEDAMRSAMRNRIPCTTRRYLR